jgi:hypothetical protein
MDSELNLVWESEPGRGPLAKGISRLRASLLSEHAGTDYDPRLEEMEGLVERLDELTRAGTRLRLRPAPDATNGEPAGLLRLAFDPESPLLEAALEELLGFTPT